MRSDRCALDSQEEQRDHLNYIAVEHEESRSRRRVVERLRPPKFFYISPRSFYFTFPLLGFYHLISCFLYVPLRFVTPTERDFSLMLLRFIDFHGSAFFLPTGPLFFFPPHRPSLRASLSLFILTERMIVFANFSVACRMSDPCASMEFSGLYMSVLRFSFCL